MRLTRDDVLAGALDQLDDTGLDGLTMQALATRLGVRAGALYWHYADKSALIDAMAEAIIGAVDIPSRSRASWPNQLRALSRSIHDALRSRRDGARLVAGTFVVQQNSLRAGAALVEILQDSGRTRRSAATAAVTVLYYILGYTIEEQAQEAAAHDGHWDQLQGQLDGAGDDGIGAVMLTTQATDTFDTGLNTIIAGLTAQRGNNSRAGSRRTGR